MAIPAEIPTNSEVVKPQGGKPGLWCRIGALLLGLTALAIMIFMVVSAATSTNSQQQQQPNNGMLPVWIPTVEDGESHLHEPITQQQEPSPMQDPLSVEDAATHELPSPFFQNEKEEEDDSYSVRAFVTPPPFLLNKEDPWTGLTPQDEEAVYWQRGTGGLSLTVMNELVSESSRELLVQVIQDWGSGVVLFQVEQPMVIGTSCLPENGKIKVCNADYGNTQWQGLTQVITRRSEDSSDDTIVAALVKLNDFYLAGATEEVLQNTLCHELGHALGVPHADEDYFNASLESCMDLSFGVAGNLQPNESDLLFLQDKYGTPTISQAVPSKEKTAGNN